MTGQTDCGRQAATAPPGASDTNSLSPAPLPTPGTRRGFGQGPPGCNCNTTSRLRGATWASPGVSWQTRAHGPTQAQTWASAQNLPRRDGWSVSTEPAGERSHRALLVPPQPVAGEGHQTPLQSRYLDRATPRGTSDLQKLLGAWTTDATTLQSHLWLLLKPLTRQVLKGAEACRGPHLCGHDRSHHPRRHRGHGPRVSAAAWPPAPGTCGDCVS